MTARTVHGEHSKAETLRDAAVRPGASTATERAAAVPIIINLCAPVDLTERDADQVRPSLVRELKRVRHRYPHSQLAIAAAGNDNLQRLGSAAAAEIGGITVAGECCTCDLAMHVAPGAAGTSNPRVRVERTHRHAWDDLDELASAHLEHADTYNRDAARRRIAAPETIAASEQALVLPAGMELSAAAKRLRDIFATADSLALRCQHMLYGAFALVTGLGLVATLLFAWLHVMQDERARYPFVVFVVVGFGAWYAAKRLRIHERYIEYRALAESARIQFYWHACGITDNTRDHCSHEMPPRLGWMHEALFSILELDDKRAPMSRDPPLVSAILAGWVNDQAGYFLRTWHAARRRYAVWHALATGLYVVSLAAAVVLTLAPGPWMHRHETAERWLSLATLILPALATIIIAYLTKIATIYQVQHYRRMAGIYADAQRKLAGASEQALGPIAIEVGREALRENAQWAAVLTQQPIDPPPSPFTKPWHDSHE